MEPVRNVRWNAAAVLAALLGLSLAADSALRSSATYDEVAYLRVGARWWRTGDQEAMTRMGSPLTFWKWQQAPVLWAIDRAGFPGLIDDPIANQRALLPLIRLGSLHVYALALALTACWARLRYGPRAMAMAAALFALSPNLIGHAALATMELPLAACSAAALLLFWRFLRDGRAAPFLGAAAACGLAFSCKFTAVLFPPILGLAWGIDRLRAWGQRPGRLLVRVGVGMAAFSAAMLGADLVVTGFATLPISERTGVHPAVARRLGGSLEDLMSRAIEVPIPCDLVGFATQMRHQKRGGMSYLFGERRARGWRHYYLVALAVKVPLAFGFLVACRLARLRRGLPVPGDALIPTAVLAFLAIASIASTRNYGLRYLLPMAPPAIVWVSALAEGGPWSRRSALAGLVGMALSVGMIHPHELSYFNILGGGPVGGRRILSDSCLDWGQGARSLARLQAARPEFRDLTVYAFGDTDPGYYGVVGRRIVVDAGAVHPGLPPVFSADTRYVAVSASLQWGPWGPAGYFRALDGVEPVALTDDFTIAVYRTADIRRLMGRPLDTTDKLTPDIPTPPRAGR